jgi:hypothetical protein
MPFNNCLCNHLERVLALWLKIHLTALRVIYPGQQVTTVASNAPAGSELESIFIHSLMDDSLPSLSHTLATGNKTKQLQVLESLSVVLNRVNVSATLLLSDAMKLTNLQIAPVEDKAVDAKTIANLRSGLMDILSSKIGRALCKYLLCTQLIFNRFKETLPSAFPRRCNHSNLWLQPCNASKWKRQSKAPSPVDHPIVLYRSQSRSRLGHGRARKSNFE